MPLLFLLQEKQTLTRFDAKTIQLFDLKSLQDNVVLVDKSTHVIKLHMFIVKKLKKLTLITQGQDF